MTLAIWILWLTISQTASTINHSTCSDWMETNDFQSLPNGIYHITNNNTNSTINVYCSFDYIKNYSFTLIESGSLTNMRSKEFLAQAPFTANISYNMNNVSYYRDSLYRLSRDWMLYLEEKLNLLFATCNFDTQFNRDWILFDLNDLHNMYNPFYHSQFGHCYDIVSANIRGHECSSNTIMFQEDVDNDDGYDPMHFQASSDGTWYSKYGSSCACDSIFTKGSSHYEANFGVYEHYNENFTCSNSSNSTTNWWLGSKVTRFVNVDIQPQSTNGSDNDNDGHTNTSTNTNTNTKEGNNYYNSTYTTYIFGSYSTSTSDKGGNGNGNENRNGSESGEGGKTGGKGNGGNGKQDDFAWGVSIYIILISVLLLILVLLCIVIIWVIRYYKKKQEKFEGLLLEGSGDVYDNFSQRQSITTSDKYDYNNHYTDSNTNTNNRKRKRKDKDTELTSINKNKIAIANPDAIKNINDNNDNISYKPPNVNISINSSLITNNSVKNKGKQSKQDEDASDDDEMYDSVDEGQGPFRMTTGDTMSDGDYVDNDNDNDEDNDKDKDKDKDNDKGVSPKAFENKEIQEKQNQNKEKNKDENNDENNDDDKNDDDSSVLKDIDYHVNTAKDSQTRGET